MVDKIVSFTVDADVYRKFCIALNLRNETEDAAGENFMRWYISEAFEEASQAYNPKKIQNVAENMDFYGKANQRIPIWALKTNQYNHKIIRAYFQAITPTGRATIDIMERFCSDRNNPELYVPTFKNNYSQLKLDGPKSPEKVFEDDGEMVTIWRDVKETLMKYKSSFCY